ncbi:NUDIX hydrolase [Candidatus Pacearchaeota archaeon]|nr:NUDIX hydrolase [Candidatus Pacearchaeota archaeon]
MTDRTNLPFRKNCEGYFVNNGKIIARDTGLGYIEFPGGGVDENEDPAEALIREATEEAGVVLGGELKKVNQINFVWGENWARSEKQKKRYQEFRGEEMHFFIGKVKELVSASGDESEDGWESEVEMEIQDIIDFISNQKPFEDDVKEYREFQLKMLEELK